MKNNYAEVKSLNPTVKWRYLLMALLVVNWGGIRESIAADCLQPPAGLIGWWPAEGNANDLTGANDGTLQGTATATAVGMVGNAFSFDGTNGFVQVPDQPLLRPTNLTIETWVRFDSLDSLGTGGSPAGEQYLVFKKNRRTSNFEGYALYKYRRSNRDYFTFGVSSAVGQIVEAFSTTQIAVGVWYHVAAVRTANALQLYVNGQLERQTNVSFALDYDTSPLCFGSSGQAYYDHKLKGQLDEVSLYNRALSADEIAVLYAAGAAGKCKGPIILAQPQGHAVLAGSNAWFAVTATGSLPLAYQWFANGALLAEATASNLSLTNIQAADAGNYWVVVSNPVGSTTSIVASLTVLWPPDLVLQPEGQTNRLGTTATFSVTAAGSLPLSFQWQLNGATLTNSERILGATNDTLQISHLMWSDAGNYTLVVSNVVGVITSAVAVLTMVGPPGIVQQPLGRTCALGADVTFAVQAMGTPPLSYQWQFNGLDLTNGPRVSGANESAMRLSQLETIDGGRYQVVITNSEGAVTSAVATLELILPPSITVQPASQTVEAGTNVIFRVVATGAEPLGFQWWFSGTNLTEDGVFSGTTGPALSLNYALPANSGVYWVVVTNQVGCVTSAVASLTVASPSSCLSPPAGLVGWWTGDGNALDIAGTNHGLLQGGATASAQGIVGQGFSFDGTNTYVQIPDSPVLKPATLSVECWVQFKNLDAPGTSVYPGQQYLVFKQNTRSYDFEGYVLSKDRTWADIILWEVTSGSGKLVRIDTVSPVTTNVWYHLVGVRGSNYIQLYFNGRLEAQTNVDFPQNYGSQPLYFGTSGQAYYDRKLNGTLDEVSLYDRALSAGEIAALYAAGAAGKCKGANGLFLTAQPQSLTLVAGSNASFSVEAMGLLPLGYQWQFNGLPIPAATNASLTLANIQPSHAGDYRVLVTNAAGTVLSGVATLSVLVPPTITLEPTNQVVWAGATVSLSVAATGSAPLIYQWQHNGLDVEGALAETLTLTNVQPQQAGTYTVSVSNPAGTTNSAAALLEVLYPPRLLDARSLENDVFAFTLSGVAGRAYQVEMTTNLVDWIWVSTLTNTAGQTEFIEPGVSTNGPRFYRVRMDHQ